MKQLAIRESQGGHPATPKTNTLALNNTTDSILIKEVETTVVRRERIYLIPRPVCMRCGEIKEHVVGAWFECVNEDCPTHDPDTGSAIPLPGEGENVIDIERGEARRAA